MLLKDDILLSVEPEDLDDNGFFKVPDGVNIIKALAFSNVKSQLKSVNINNCKSILYGAFYKCKTLESVIGSPELIEHQAFCECTNLKNFDFTGTQYIGQQAFEYSALQEIDISNVKIVGKRAFGRTDLTKVVGCPPEIFAETFAGCEKLVCVDLSKTKKIGEEAFVSCLSLAEIDATGVDAICNKAFWSCASLQKIKIKSLQTIKGKAFHFCFKLKELYIEDKKSMPEKIKDIGLGKTQVFTLTTNKAKQMYVGTHAISEICDIEKGIFISNNGIPFVIDECNKIIALNENKDLFLRLIQQ